MVSNFNSLLVLTFLSRIAALTPNFPFWLSWLSRNFDFHLFSRFPSSFTSATLNLVWTLPLFDFSFVYLMLWFARPPPWWRMLWHLQIQISIQNSSFSFQNSSFSIWVVWACFVNNGPTCFQWDVVASQVRTGSNSHWWKFSVQVFQVPQILEC